MVLWGVYLATAAPDLTAWDASELVTAAHTLGIPHPPGTPLWVLIAHVAASAFGAAPPPRAITLLSVAATALAGGLSAWLVTRWCARLWTGESAASVVAGIAGALVAGTMYSVWQSATETEVYAVALLLGMAQLVVGELAGDEATDPAAARRWRGLLAYLALLAVPLHLSSLVTLPAAVALAWRAPRPRPVELLGWAALGALACSAVAVLPLLAAQAPRLDSGHPVTWSALADVLRRAQYDVAGLWPRRAPAWLQVANVVQWADWQVAFGLHPSPVPSPGRTALTVAYALLGASGLRTLWREDRRVGRALLLLVAGGTLGVAAWLNLRAGPTFGAGVLPSSALHEARERDYFFVFGFWGWGLLAGMGAVYLMRWVTRRHAAPWARPAWLAIPLVVALLPLSLNWPVADRTREPVATLPRTAARLLLEAVPPNGVLVTAGDNDTFPLWYLQQVEQLRPDVRVAAVPLLGAAWYREQLRRDGLLAEAASWRSMPDALGRLMQGARSAGRPVHVTPLVAPADRRALDPLAGWVFDGLTYTPSNRLPAGTIGIDEAAVRRTDERIPRSALDMLPAGTDPAVRTLQRMLRCARVPGPADGLLVVGCGGP